MVLAPLPVAMLFDVRGVKRTVGAGALRVVRQRRLTLLPRRFSSRAGGQKKACRDGAGHYHFTNF